MDSLVSHSSPTSFQLRWRLHRRKTSPAFLRAGFPPWELRRRLSLVTVASAPGGESDGRSSRASPVEASDRFAGWSSEESGGGSQEGGQLGGIMGAALAGIFFSAGITFAAISLTRKNAGMKKQMEPMVVEQEVSVLQNKEIESFENETSSTESHENHSDSMDSKSGIGEDNISSVVNHDTSLDCRVDFVPYAKSSAIEDDGSAGTDLDAFHEQSCDENSYDSSIHKLPSGLTDSSLTPTGQHLCAVEVSDEFSLNDSTSDPASVISDFSINLSTNTKTGVVAGVSSSITDLTNPDTQLQDEAPPSADVENSKLPLDPDRSLHDKLADDSEVDGSNNLGVNTALIYQCVYDDVIKSEAHDSRKEESDLRQNDVTSQSLVDGMNADALSEMNSQINSDPSEMLEAPYETIIPSLERGNVDVDEYFGAPASLPVGPSENQPAAGSQYDTCGGKLLSESEMTWKSFSSAGIPAPSLVSAVSQVSLGKILVPAVVDQVQGQALAALQVLKVIEADVQPGDICSRREYARWLVSASSILTRNTTSKVYPAMFIENVTELAFDDVTPEDPDFSSIQGLAEAGLISSRLSNFDINSSGGKEHDPSHFSPEGPVSRQDLVCWKIALEKRQLPEVDRKILHQCSGYIDIDKINPDAWPALVADLSTREHGIIPLAFGYTRLFQPDKPVTNAQAAIALATGDAAEVVGEELARIDAESMADAAVAAHTALVAEVEKDLNASFEQELIVERQKVDTVEKLAEQARFELEKLKKERDEENDALIRGRLAVESEMEVLSKLRNDVEEQLQTLISNKMEIAFERERINKLRREAEKENETIVQLQYELEVERKALSMARAWAEEEAKKANEKAKALEEARERWEKHGLKIVIDGDLHDDELAGTTWRNARKQHPFEGTIRRGENLLNELKSLAMHIKGKSAAVIEKIVRIIMSVVSALKRRVSEASKHVSELSAASLAKARRSMEEFRENASEFGSSIADRSSKSVKDLQENAAEFRSSIAERSSKSMQELQENASGFCSNIRGGAKRVVEDCRESLEKITQRFKT